jgi:acid phosphatase
MNSDGHNTTLDFASDWVANFLAPLLMDDYFMKDTMILLTYDESETYSKPNQITSLLLGGAVPQELRGTKDDTFYTHYSILSTLQNNWDLSNLGRFDVGANVFNFVAEKTGYVNQDLTAEQRASVDLSVSYGGFLNTVPGMLRPLTAPNQKLVGAGGKGLCRRIMDEWADATAALTPYDGSGNIWLPLEYGAQQPAG